MPSPKQVFETPSAARVGGSGAAPMAGATGSLRVLAEQGYDQAQFSLGVLYDKGQGVQQDYVEAVTAHSKAAPSTIPAA